MDKKTRKKIEEIKKEYGKVKLNLGCYKDIRKGYINLDKEKFFEWIDVVHNLEKFPYPFEDNTFDEILANCILEHLNVDRIKFYEELHRICKNEAIIKLKVPFREKIWRHADHRGEGFTFQQFRSLCSQEGYITKKKFELIKLDHEPTVFARLIPSKLRYILSYFIGEIIENIFVEMKVCKNIAQREIDK